MVVRVTLPVPVIVTLNVPDGVVEAVVMVSVDEPPAVTEAGLNDAVAPAGSPLADRDTVWAEPEVTAVATVAVVERTGGRRCRRSARPRWRSRCAGVVEQVGSPVWAGTATAFQASP